MIDLEPLFAQAGDLLCKARYAVALTGAGISTPSGIPDFRSPTSGLWDQYDPMEVASIYSFRREPEKFYAWMRPLAQCIASARPNPAHLALSCLEKHGPLKCIITQNIDMLHTKAGSRLVYEVHGHTRFATCLGCHQQADGEQTLKAFLETGVVPRCQACGGVLKPDVILFGEQLPWQIFAAAEAAVAQCDLLLVAGSSLEVAPVGDLPLLAKQVGARLIFINLGETYYDHLADVIIRRDVAQALPRLAQPFISA